MWIKRIFKPQVYLTPTKPKHSLHTKRYRKLYLGLIFLPSKKFSLEPLRSINVQRVLKGKNKIRLDRINCLNFNRKRKIITKNNFQKVFLCSVEFIILQPRFPCYLHFASDSAILLYYEQK